MTVTKKRFRATVDDAGRGRARIALPFDPDEVWGVKARHHVTGTVGGHKIRGPLDADDALPLGSAWLRDCDVAIGMTVEVELAPEGPQRDGLDPDIAAALDASPAAAAFFDSLAQFYRKGYLTWIAATKRRPDERARRITEVVRLLEAGKKQRP